MGKLVLGILTVVLLQVIFFGYTSRYWSTPKVADLVKTVPPASDAGRSTQPPQVIPLPAQITEAPRLSPSRNIEYRSTPARARVRARSVSVHRIQKRTPSDREPAITYSAYVRPRSQNERLSAVVPRGHTMVLVDNLALVRNNNTTDVSKPRKRSLLAKSFSVVVKKPWSWMKSFASKLD